VHTGLHQATGEVAVTAMVEGLGTRLEDEVIEVPSEGILDAPAGSSSRGSGHAKAAMRAGIEKAAGRSRLIRRGPLRSGV
jgi:hypothetical protein